MALSTSVTLCKFILICGSRSQFVWYQSIVYFEDGRHEPAIRNKSLEIGHGQNQNLQDMHLCGHLVIY